MMLVPRILRVSSSARVKPSTLMSTVDTMVNAVVKKKAWMKVSSCQILK